MCCTAVSLHCDIRQLVTTTATSSISCAVQHCPYIVVPDYWLQQSHCLLSLHLSVSVVRRKLPAAYNSLKFCYSCLTAFHKLIGASSFVEIQISKNQIGEYIVRYNLFCSKIKVATFVKGRDFLTKPSIKFPGTD
jgi:hypothetical protein